MLAHDKSSKKTKQGDTVDPNVIDENMIIDAIKEYNQENNIITSDSLQITSIMQLSLSFKSLKSIKNLDGLNNLTKLQLDNNNITEIEQLGHLRQLKWLDLSFNAIKEIKGIYTKNHIKGLDQLTELEDLSLFDNRIKRVGDGLDNCQKLNVLSIGNNQFDTYEDLIATFGINKQAQNLRFQFLQVLNVRGNPFTLTDQDQEYRSHLIVNLPGLKYLDYQFIDESDRKLIFENDATQKFTNTAVKQNEYFQLVKSHEQNKSDSDMRMKEKMDSNMHMLDSLSFDLLQHEELPKLKSLNKAQIETESQKFKTKVDEAVSQDIQKKVIEKNIKKIQNVQNFKKSWQERIRLSEQETINILRDFEKKKKRVFRDADENKRIAEERQEERRTEEKIQPFLELKAYTQKIKDQLMEVEVQLVDELDSALNEFHNKQTDIINTDIDPIITGGFKKVEEAINDFSQQLTSIAKTAQEAFNPQMLEQTDLTEEEEERMNLLESKEALITTIQAIKESLIEKQNTRQGDILQAVSKDTDNFKEQVQKESYERNRKNISQIHYQIEKYVQEIQEHLDENQSDSDNN